MVFHWLSGLIALQITRLSLTGPLLSQWRKFIIIFIIKALQCECMHNMYSLSLNFNLFCQLTDQVIEYFLTAPLVTFVEMPEENLQKNVVELDSLVLHCELSRPDATTQWYKDGVEIKPGNNIIMKADGTQRQLIIQTTQLSDSGTYTCRAGDNTLLFKVSIRGMELTLYVLKLKTVSRFCFLAIQCISFHRASCDDCLSQRRCPP